LVVAAIIGILLAIAIHNIIKARISANEANARKAMQTLRDAEAIYFEQDLDGEGARDYTPLIGTLAGPAGTLRNPEGTEAIEDALIDSSFELADVATACVTILKPGTASRLKTTATWIRPSLCRISAGNHPTQVFVRQEEETIRYTETAL
jgi:type II secretory pathway pseudopilin PulG